MKVEDRILARYCQSFFDSALREYLGDLCLQQGKVVEVVDFEHNIIVEVERTRVMTFVANYLERAEVQARER